MAFTKEQADVIKKQLLTQLKNLPQENKEQIKNYVEKLNEEQLEEFLKQNKIQISTNEEGQEKQKTECVFCEITKGKIPSYKIAENKKAIAVLEINPLSRGHALILPLKHLSTEEIPKSSLTLAQKIAKKIKKKLKADDIKIETSNFMNHAFLNIIPIYKDVSFQKRKADEKELEQLKKKLETKPRLKLKQKKEKIKTENISKIPKISFRIP